MMIGDNDVLFGTSCPKAVIICHRLLYHGPDLDSEGMRKELTQKFLIARIEHLLEHLDSFLSKTLLNVLQLGFVRVHKHANDRKFLFGRIWQVFRKLLLYKHLYFLVKFLFSPVVLASLRYFQELGLYTSADST